MEIKLKYIDPVGTVGVYGKIEVSHISMNTRFNSKQIEYLVSLIDDSKSVTQFQLNETDVLYREHADELIQLLQKLSPKLPSIKPSSGRVLPSLERQQEILKEINSIVETDLSYKVQTLPDDFVETEFKLTCDFKSQDDNLVSLFNKLKENVDLDNIIEIFSKKPSSLFFIKIDENDGIIGCDHIGQYESKNKKEDDGYKSEVELKSFEYLYLNKDIILPTNSIYIELALDKLFLIQQYLLTGKISENYQLTLGVTPL